MQHSLGNIVTLRITFLRIPHLLALLSIAFFQRCSSQSCSPTLGCVPLPRLLLNNTFPQRNVIVSSTCGGNGQASQYCTLSLPSCDSRNAYICDGSTSYTSDKMYDLKQDPYTGTLLPDYATYWQSANTVDVAGGFIATPQFVTVDLSDVFLIRKVTAVFISPLSTPSDPSDMRPNAVSFEGRSGPDGPWVAWRHYASDCARFYPGVLTQDAAAITPTYGATTPVCIEKYFAGDTSTITSDRTGVQGVTFNPAVEYNSEFLTDSIVQSIFMVSALRIRLDYPARSEPLLSYYAIANLEVEGSCACFGHSVECLGFNEANCNCLHNTSGANCDECLPTYNNVPWSMGTPTSSNYCEMCDCNEYGLSCHYDDALGRGVCDNCTHYTTGLNCDFCVDFFYVNPNRTAALPSDVCFGLAGTQSITYNCNEPCIPCNCNSIGTSALSRYNCANATGQCLCKSFVEGRSCDDCQIGYWNLSIFNDFGCQQCDCNWFGTINNSNACDKQTGACLCKANVASPGRCDICEVGYFNLIPNNNDGCEACDCDLGASFTQNCPVDSGACSCKNFIGGRTCRDPFTGYFGPSLDHLTFEAEFAYNATSLDVVKRVGHGDPDATNTGIGFLRVTPPFSATFNIEVGATFLYDIILRYENVLASFIGAMVTIQLQNPELETTSVYECAGTNLSITAVLQLPLSFPISSGKGFMSAGTACLLSSPTAVYQLRIDVPQSPNPAGSNVYFLLDSVVLLPVLDRIEAFAIANSSVKDQMTACFGLAQNVSNGQRKDNGCPAIEYSLMTDVYDGAVNCQCNVVGSQSFGCNPLGGQCYCKPNVIMLDCSVCRVDSYGFSSGLGCTRCNCNPTGSVGPSCDDSGTCTCHANVTGVGCDRCLDNYFGLQTGQGCSPCVCNPTYTLDGFCMDDGQCPCKPGVGGLACDRCANHYFNLTLDGCSWCGCNVDGSQSSSACNNQSGSCYCKANTLGVRCDACRDGYFGLGRWGSEGCIPCYCSGRSSNCTSAPDWHYAIISSTWSLLTGSTATQEKWKGVDESWNRFELPNPTLIGTDDTTHVMRMAVDNTNIQNGILYFLATDSYLGNKRGSYGQNLQFFLSLQVPAGVPKDTFYVSSTAGDVIIQGTGLPFTLVYPLPNLPSTSRTNYTILLREDNWYINSTVGPRSTYAQMQLTLGSVESIRIRAKYYNVVGAATDLHSASMEYAVHDPYSASPLVNNVEQCGCSLGYTGQFCELCADGYTRTVPNSGQFTECTRCFCNNHDRDGSNCDRESGNCVCDHNTTGRQCDRCLDGFYGHAESGRPAACKPCLCPGNVAEQAINVFSSSCVFSEGDVLEHRCSSCSAGYAGNHCEFCMENWFGTPLDPTNAFGRCSPCNCYGRASTCNATTGACINCTDNTVGRTCNECANGFYGNPIISQCRPCSCVGVGMTGRCDSLTGQCDCQPYVTGFNCDRCQLYAYSSNLSASGCQPCNCSVLGSFGDPPTCNPVTGQCDCKAFVTGLQCNGCQDTYWNVGSEGCQACDCSTIGTTIVFGQPFGMCDLVTGQCQCNDPGISGRRCDMCARATKQEFAYIYGLSIGTYPTCQLCGDCYDSTGKMVDSTAVAINTSVAQLDELWFNSYNDITYDAVNSSLNEINQSLASLSVTMNLMRQNQQDIETFSDSWGNTTNLYDWHDAATSSAISTAARIQTTSDSIRQWLNSDLIFNGVVIPRGDVLLSSFNISKDRQDLIFTTAANTYSTIWRNINILNNSSGIVEMMKEAVAKSMQLAEYSRQLRTAADATRASGTTDPFPTLNAIQSTVTSMLGINNTVATICATLNSTLNQCALVINQIDSMSGVSYNETFSILLVYQNLRTSAVYGQDTAQLAKNNADRLYNQSSAAKQGLTQSLVSLAGALQSLTSMNAAASNILYLSAAISAMSVPTLATIQDLARQISAASVASDAVARVATLANQQLAIANDVQHTAISAGNQSTNCLQQLNSVTTQTINASQLAQQADALRSMGYGFFLDINNVITYVSGKAFSAQTLANSTGAKVSGILSVLSSIQSQFLTLPDRVHSARLSAESSVTALGDWSTAYSLIQAASSALQLQISDRSGIVDLQTSAVMAARTEFLSFQSELSGLSQTVRSMNTEITTQLEDLKGLNRDLTYLQNQLVVMTILLEQLGVSSSVNCNT